MTTLTAGDGHTFAGYEVTAAEATAAVVIVQEIFGVNAHIRSVVDRYAQLGFRAIAPALFDRAEPGVELAYDQEGVERGRALRGSISWDDTMLDVAAAVARVADTGPVAVVGYCFGGSVAWLAAHSLPIAAAVGYYGGAITEFIERAPAVPTMLHYGAEDPAIPVREAREVAARHPEVAVHIYDGAGHGFNCDVRGSFAPDAAALALDRTLAFLAEHGVRGR